MSAVLFVEFNLYVCTQAEIVTGLGYVEEMSCCFVKLAIDRTSLCGIEKYPKIA